MKENIIVIADNAGWADIYACDGKAIYHANVGGEVYTESIISLLEGGCPIADGWDGEYADAMEARGDMRAYLEAVNCDADYDVLIDTLPGNDITDIRGITAWQGLDRSAIPSWMEEILAAKFGESRIYGEG